MKRGGSTVLVVDDEPTITDGLRLTLEAEGYRVLTASSVQAALVEATRSEVQGAIVDLMLPDGDGIALTRELKRQDPSIEAIIITAYGSVRKAMEATKGAGAFYVLEKPFDPDEVNTLDAGRPRSPGAGGRELRPPAPARRTGRRHGNPGWDPLHATSTRYSSGGG